MRSLICLALVLLSCVQASPVSAGGWHSSGGELFQDAKNPWFVRNTSDVKYCIKVDAASMSANDVTIKRLVVSALSYWKAEFQRTIRPGYAAVDIATQTFTEVECALGIADIQFLFGYGTLATDQIAYLKSPEKYIGVTVRTDYDEEQLRGKGFVFISSDLGAHSYMSADLRRYALLPEAWKQETLLFYAILHEIGHVFGIPHTGSGLMSEVFLEQLLNQRVYEAFVKFPIEDFFFPSSQLEICGTLQGYEKVWFGATLDTECIRFKVPGPMAPIEVYGREKGMTSYVLLGRFEALKENMYDIRHRPVVHLQLPSNQKVFTAQETSFRSFMLGGMFYDAGIDAAYRPVVGILKPACLRVTSTSLHVMGAVSGQVKTVFNHNSWISTKLYLAGP